MQAENSSANHDEPPARNPFQALKEFKSAGRGFWHNVPDADWNGAVADPEVVAEAWRSWRDEVAFAQRFVTDADDLGMSGTMSNGDGVALREVLVHMIEEYSRHCGHADLLRERIDGRVGQ